MTAEINEDGVCQACCTPGGHHGPFCKIATEQQIRDSYLAAMLRHRDLEDRVLLDVSKRAECRSCLMWIGRAERARQQLEDVERRMRLAERLRGPIERYKKQASDWQAKYTVLKTENNGLRSHARRLQRDIDELREKIAELQGQSRADG